MIAAFLVLLIVWTGFLAFINRFIQVDGNVTPSSINPSSCDRLAVVIVCRNEIHAIKQCLQSLHEQTYQNRFTVYVVDDHSEDGTLEYLQSGTTYFERFDLVTKISPGSGKKAALKFALQQIDSDIIYFTDADCTLHPRLIQHMLNTLTVNSVDAVFGPVIYNENGLWNRMLAYEHLNTQAISEGFIAAGKAISVNGGNMMISSSAKEAYLTSLSEAHAGGDDVFFAQALLKHQFVGAFSKETSVITNPPSSINHLVNQRTRWGSKFNSYHSHFAQVLPAFVFLVSFGFISGPVLALFSLISWQICAMMWICKWLIEYAFHCRWFRKYDFRPWLIEGLLMSIAYPIYFVFIGVLSLFRKRFEWKGRSVSIPLF